MYSHGINFAAHCEQNGYRLSQRRFEFAQAMHDFCLVFVLGEAMVVEVCRSIEVLWADFRCDISLNQPLVLEIPKLL